MQGSKKPARGPGVSELGWAYKNEGTKRSEGSSLIFYVCMSILVHPISGQTGCLVSGWVNAVVLGILFNLLTKKKIVSILKYNYRQNKLVKL